jgi:CII-binding regulator of phage lambda lysogenization HflD
LDAQKKLAEYQSNLGVSESRLEAEKDAVESLKQAKAEIAQWQTSARSKEPNIGSLIGQLTDIISILEQVPAGTTVSAEAQKLLGSARHTRDKLYMN